MNSKQVYDSAWGAFVRSITVVHTAAHRATGGRLWSKLPRGGRLAFLTTLGRKSGEWRVTPLLSVQVDGEWIVTGSNGGQTRMPGWVFNARSDSRCTFEVDGKSWPGHIYEVTGEERDHLYAALTRVWKFYAMYERKAGRHIPVFRVTGGVPSGPDSMAD